MKTEDDWYRELGLRRGCGENEIKRAYKKLALRHHPDKGGDPEKFKRISEAYAALTNPAKPTVRTQQGFDEFDIFERFFEGDPFFSTNDFFRGHDFFGRGSRGRDLFGGRDFFGDGGSNFSTSFSKSTTTVIKNGVRKTTTTVRHPDGRIETTCSEEEEQPRSNQILYPTGRDLFYY